MALLKTFNRNNTGWHSVRFLPNWENPDEPISRETTYFGDGVFISKEEYEKLRADGDTACGKFTRFTSYAVVDGEDCKLRYGKSLHAAIEALLHGEYYTNAEGELITSDVYHRMPNKMADEFKHIVLRRTNSFDLQSDVSVSFRTSLYNGTIKYDRFTFVFDKANIVWKVGDDKDSIFERLKRISATVINTNEYEVC